MIKSDRKIPDALKGPDAEASLQLDVWSANKKLTKGSDHARIAHDSRIEYLHSDRTQPY